MPKQSKSQELNAKAREELAKGGTDAVKKAIADILARYIDGRAGVEWDNLASGDARDQEHFVALEIVAEWLDDDNAEVAAWRTQRFNQHGR